MGAARHRSTPSFRRDQGGEFLGVFGILVHDVYEFEWRLRFLVTVDQIATFHICKTCAADLDGFGFSLE